MIISKLYGRLGNQMFQYACGRALAERIGADLKIDTWLYAAPPFDPYTLGRFRISADHATRDEIRPFLKYKTKWGRRWFLHNRLVANRTRYFNERQFNYDPGIETLTAPVYLDGYWQSERYFKDIAPTLHNEFKLRAQLSDQSERLRERIASSPCPISIHVRRGDYVTNKQTNAWHGICEKRYYTQAILVMMHKYPDAEFFVFSDDPVLAREAIILDHKVTYIPFNFCNPEEDMVLMSHCHHHVIANSSFSWWGAWLNQRADKYVIAPDRWFNTPKMNTVDLLPEGWVSM